MTTLSTGKKLSVFGVSPWGPAEAPAERVVRLDRRLAIGSPTNLTRGIDMDGLMTTLHYVSRFLLAAAIGIAAVTALIVTIAIRAMAPMGSARSINRGPYW